MTDQRRHLRIDDTRDLSVTVRASGRIATRVGVLNLSRGGVLIDGVDLEVGDVARFELAGPGFRYAGVAAVTHHTDGASGLRVLCWHGPVERAVSSLVDRRSRPRHTPARHYRRTGATAAA